MSAQDFIDNREEVLALLARYDHVRLSQQPVVVWGQPLERWGRRDKGAGTLGADHSRAERRSASGDLRPYPPVSVNADGEIRHHGVVGRLGRRGAGRRRLCGESTVDKGGRGGGEAVHVLEDGGDAPFGDLLDAALRPEAGGRGDGGAGRHRLGRGVEIGGRLRELEPRQPGQVEGVRPADDHLGVGRRDSAASAVGAAIFELPRRGERGAHRGGECRRLDHPGRPLGGGCGCKWREEQGDEWHVVCLLGDRSHALDSVASATKRIYSASLNSKKEKNCDWIVANNVSDTSIGFNSEDNQVSIFYKNNSSETLYKMSKSLIAKELVNRVIDKLN